MSKTLKHLLLSTILLFLLSGCSSFTEIPEVDLVQAKPHSKKIYINAKGFLSEKRKYTITQDVKNMLLSDLNYCTKKKGFYYEHVLACDTFIYLQRSLNLSKVYSRKEADYEINVTISSIGPEESTLRNVWSYSSMLTLSIIPYWQKTQYSVEAQISSINNKLIEKVHLNNNSLYVSFLPLILYMPFAEDQDSLTFKIHKNLIEQFSLIAMDKLKLNKPVQN